MRAATLRCRGAALASASTFSSAQHSLRRAAAGNQHLHRGQASRAATAGRSTTVNVRANLVARIARLLRPTVVQPHGELLRYLEGLPKDQQVDVFAKLAAAGYAEPGNVHNVDVLDNEGLKEIGIEPSALRSKLIKAFALLGPSKVVVLVDEEGNEQEVEFRSKREFERWAASNLIKLSREDGVKEYIGAWEHLQHGGRYSTNTALKKTYADLDSYNGTLDKRLVDEVVERALARMRVDHPDAVRLFGGEGGSLRWRHAGTQRHFYEILVAANCFKVLELKEVVDSYAAQELRSGMKFIKEGIARGEADFNFAKCSDGTDKEMKGVLGGLCKVVGDQDENELEQQIAEAHWELYLVDGVDA